MLIPTKNDIITLGFVMVMVLSGAGTSQADSIDSTPVLSDNYVTRANFQQAEQWSAENQFERTQDIWITPLWIPGKNALFYQQFILGQVHCFYVDLDTDETRDLTVHPGFQKIYLSESQAANPSNPTQSNNVPEFSNPQLLPENKGVAFNLGDHRYKYLIESDMFRKVGKPVQTKYGQYLDFISPDSKYRIDINDQNLSLAFPGQLRMKRKITTDGETHYNVNASSIVWSPDSTRVAFLREDWRKVKDIWLVDHYANPRPSLETLKWPVPGDKIEQHELWVYDSKSDDLIRIDADKWDDQTLAFPIWSPDSQTLFIHRMSRDWLKLDLCAVDMKSKRCHPIIKDRDHRQLINRLPTHIIQTTGEILWWSMRDGWGHYYLYNPENQSFTAVTSGDYHAGQMVHIDETDRKLFFMGNNREPNRNPYLHYLYSVNFDGTDLSLLTPEDAEHEVTFSSTGQYFFDCFSRADKAPAATIRKANGSIIRELGQSDISLLTEADWKPPEIFCVKAADGFTDMWGVMFKPYDFNPAKKYPVITYGYPGKEGESIPFKFYNNSWFTTVSTALAQYGFIVVVSGNRGGTPERSYEYYNFGEDNLRDYPIADKKAVLEHLGKEHSFMDLDRVGIMGPSSGGFMAATAILLEPDFFKVAVAKSGNYDNNLYYHHWNERYGKLNIRTGTCNDLVNNLKGRLLIIHGDKDRYVPVSLALRLAYDLMMANKRFDMFIVPNGDHFWGDNWQYILRYIELYFVENLMGDQSWSPDLK